MREGIDLSVHNGVVDFEAVRKAGKEFVFVRVGWCGYDGRIVVHGGLDRRFRENVEGALAAGLEVGVYLYSYATGEGAAKRAAAELGELIKEYRLSYPIVLDLEDSQYCQVSMKEGNTAVAKAFLKDVEEAGYYAMLYSYKSFVENYLDMEQLVGFDFWLAEYGRERPRYQGAFGIWQYAGDKEGRCPGVVGACDLNRAYKDYAQLIVGAGKNWLVGEPLPEGELAALSRRLEDAERTLAAIGKLLEEG